MTTTHKDVLRRALEAGEDPHTAWAAYSLGKKPGDVTKEERQQFKAENHLLLYSGSFLDTINWPQKLMGKSTKVHDDARCPECQQSLTGATHPEEQVSPSPGDVCVCIYCSTVCVFNTDLTVRLPTLEEIDALPEELKIQLWLCRKAVSRLHKKGGKNASSN